MISEKFINQLSDAALNTLIKQYSKRANSRIDRLLKTGLWQQSASIQRHWSPITHTAPIGTNSGRFSRSVQGSRATREEQLKQIIRFLNAKTTVTAVRAEVKNANKKLGVDENMNMSAVWELYNMYHDIFSTYKIPSELEIEMYTELLTSGASTDSIMQAIDTAVETSKTDGDDFVTSVKNNIKFWNMG